MPTFDPKFAFFWGLGGIVLGLVAKTPLPHDVPAQIAMSIQDWASYISIFAGAVTTYLVGYSNEKTGLLVTK